MIKPHRKLTGGEAAVKSLKKENVKHVFGLIGSATMEMFDALYHEKKIKFNQQLIHNMLTIIQLTYSQFFVGPHPGHCFRTLNQ